MPNHTHEYLKAAAKVIQDHRNDRLSKGHKVVQLTRAHANEAVAVMSASFNGDDLHDAEPAFDWALGPTWRGRYHEPGRQHFVSYYMRWVFLTCVKYGYVLGVRDTEGTLLACVGVLPPGAEHVTDTTSFLKPHMLLLSLAMRGPPPDVTKPQVYPLVQARMAAIGAATKAAHAKHATNAGGWYVYVVATAPEAQGKGCTRTALDVVGAVADASGHACSLEAYSERNAAVYSRLGYQVLGKQPISEDEKLTAGGNAAPVQRYMARPVKAMA